MSVYQLRWFHFAVGTVGGGVAGGAAGATIGAGIGASIGVSVGIGVEHVVTNIVGAIRDACKYLPGALAKPITRNPDIAVIDELVKRYGLDREQRRRLHDEMQKEKSGRKDLPIEEIIEIIEDILGGG